jgi:hypothetical protein
MNFSFPCEEQAKKEKASASVRRSTNRDLLASRMWRHLEVRGASSVPARVSAFASAGIFDKKDFFRAVDSAMVQPISGHEHAPEFQGWSGSGAAVNKQV